MTPLVQKLKVNQFFRCGNFLRKANFW